MAVENFLSARGLSFLWDRFRFPSRQPSESPSRSPMITSPVRSYSAERDRFAGPSGLFFTVPLMEKRTAKTWKFISAIDAALRHGAVDHEAGDSSGR